MEAESPSLDSLGASDGVEYNLQWIKDRFLDMQITQIGRGLSEFFRKLKRRPNQTIRDYIGEFDCCHARLQECGCSPRGSIRDGGKHIQPSGLAAGGRGPGPCSSETVG